MGTLPPPETRPNIYLRETPTRVIGLQTGTACAKLRFALHCALLSVRPTTAAEDHAKGAEKANERKGGAPPYRRIPPETRPNIHLTKTPTAGKQDRINITAPLTLTIATRQSTTGQAPSLVPQECASPTTTLCCIERFAVLGSASDHLRPPDSELTPNIIIPNLTEHYVSPLVLKDREHKSGSHVPNIFFSLKGEERQSLPDLEPGDGSATAALLIPPRRPLLGLEPGGGSPGRSSRGRRGSPVRVVRLARVLSLVPHVAPQP